MKNEKKPNSSDGLDQSWAIGGFDVATLMAVAGIALMGISGEADSSQQLDSDNSDKNPKVKIIDIQNQEKNTPSKSESTGTKSPKPTHRAILLSKDKINPIEAVIIEIEGPIQSNIPIRLLIKQ